jgi:hypothetical protein
LKMTMLEPLVPDFDDVNFFRINCMLLLC